MSRFGAAYWLLVAFVQGFCAALIMFMLFPNACHADELGRTTFDDHSTITLYDDPTPITGFMLCSMRRADGSSMGGCIWTVDAHHKIMVSNGRGEFHSFPMSFFTRRTK
jgi:hypothetical protein